MNKPQEKEVLLYMLGTGRLEQAGQIRPFGFVHPLYLLAYLAIKNTWVNRNQISALLYPETTFEIAKARLRQLLHRIRTHGVAPNLEATPEQLRWTSGSDIHHFQEQLKQKNWQAASSNYHGNLLEGMSYDDSELGDWLETERQNLQRQWCEASLQYVQQLEQQQQFTSAITVLETVLEANPFAEDALLVYLRVATLAGRRDGALAVYASFCSRLQQEFAMQPHPNTQEAFKLLRQKDLVLPSGTTLLGRDQEQHLLQSLLATKNHRLISLVGLGGMGKTRLALEVIRYHPEKTVFIACQTLGSEQSLELHLASSLGIELEPQLSTSHALHQALQNQNLLLVLDNVEHQVEALRQVLNDLADLPNISFLITSRERLGVSQEFVIELRGISCQIQQQTSDAAKVFMQLMRSHQSALEIQSRDLEVIEQIVRQLEGLPLALELAAAWTRVMPLVKISSELQYNLDFLADGLPGIQVRHKGIRAVFEQTWSLLEPPLQMVLQRLSVFVGSIEPDSALEITGGQPKDLLRLLDFSILQRSLGHADGVELHSLIRVYAHEKLSLQLEQKNATYQKLLDLMLAKINLYGAMAQSDDVQALKREYTNIETVLKWANENRPQQALEICMGLRFFWEALGLFEEALIWLEQSIYHAQAIKKSPLYTASLGALGATHWFLAQPEKAHDCFTKALAIALENQQLENQFKIYSYLGMMAAYRQDFVKVEEYYGKSFAVCEQLGLKDFQLHNTYARILLGQDKPEAAEYHAATGLAYAKLLKDQKGICAGLATLGSVQMQKNHLKTAKKSFLMALQMAKSLEDLGEEAGILYCLGIIEYKSGQFVAAQTLLAQSFKPLLAVAEYAYLVSVLEFLASIQLLLTQPKQALMLWIAAKQLQKRQVVLFDPTVYRNTVSVQEIHKKLDAVEYCKVCQSLRGISLEKLNEKIMQFTQDLAILKP